ncbi:ABC transporter ATP-binding protein (plasmid) [Photobacterium sp. GJ3]|uniref:ABC transporter transmembrane domain-containing protein n=1 Tax=Photobacterium sp. GJ3 TaxID=2829502 RepID=UPI001B8A9913|nr:ABC transporter ATP-binding protein [Photobacterium sp. GJ3]QUJ70158.1 ABC transporter ATP-binding protein [Photobacterium sp. GJ3]
MQLTDHLTPGQALRAMLNSEKVRVITSISFAFITTLIEFIPWLMLYLAAQALFSQQSATPYLVIAGAAFVIRHLCYGIAVWQAHLAAYHMIQKVRQHLVHSLATMPSEKLRRYHRADLEKRLTDDCQGLEPLIAHHGTDIINGLLMPVLLTGLLFYIDWRLGLIALLPLPVAALVQTLIMRHFSTRLAGYQSVIDRMHVAQMDFLQHIGVMKLFAVDTDSFRQLRKALRRHNRVVNFYTRQLIGGWVSFVTVAQSSFILTVPVALMLYAAGSISLVDLTMATAITAGVLKPWQDLTQVVSQIQKSSHTLIRLLPLFQHAQQTTGVCDSELRSLSCDNLTISRDGHAVLTQVTTQLHPGDRVLIQGQSGSGKSSLLEVLSGGCCRNMATG